MTGASRQHVSARSAEHAVRRRAPARGCAHGCGMLSRMVRRGGGHTSRTPSRDARPAAGWCVAQGAPCKMAGGAVRNVGHGGGVHGLRRGAACAACLMRGSALATHGGSIDELVQPQGVTADTDAGQPKYISTPEIPCPSINRDSDMLQIIPNDINDDSKTPVGNSRKGRHPRSTRTVAQRAAPPAGAQAHMRPVLISPRSSTDHLPISAPSYVL